MIITVKKIGGSVAVVIPRGVAREMELVEGMPLEMSSSGDAIVMRKSGPPQRTRRPIEAIVRGMKSSSYQRHSRELAERGPVGREIW